MPNFLQGLVLTIALVIAAFGWRMVYQRYSAGMTERQCSSVEPREPLHAVTAGPPGSRAREALVRLQRASACRLQVFRSGRLSLPNHSRRGRCKGLGAADGWRRDRSVRRGLEL